jgi:hypothetical protein
MAFAIFIRRPDNPFGYFASNHFSAHDRTNQRSSDRSAGSVALSPSGQPDSPAMIRAIARSNE